MTTPTSLSYRTRNAATAREILAHYYIGLIYSAELFSGIQGTGSRTGQFLDQTRHGFQEFVHGRTDVERELVKNSRRRSQGGIGT